MSMNNSIYVDSLVKRFESLTAVDSISFSVGKGEFFAFLGPNGAGKSTTIKILCTLLGPDSGTVEICGLVAGRQDKEIRRRIGVVFQDNCLDDLLTVEQNLILRAGMYENDRRRIKQSLDRVCSILKTGELLGRPFGKLSGGQKRRCEIARALMNSPDILILDEPTTGLDPQARLSVWECIARLRKEHGTTVFITTHYMEEAAAADNVAIIDGGRIVASGTPAGLKDRYTEDLLKVAVNDTARARSIFGDLKFKYEERSGTFDIAVPNSITALEILKKLENCLHSFEVLKGTMDDVFLNITGKSLRED